MATRTTEWVLTPLLLIPLAVTIGGIGVYLLFGPLAAIAVLAGTAIALLFRYLLRDLPQPLLILGGLVMGATVITASHTLAMVNFYSDTLVLPPPIKIVPFVSGDGGGEAAPDVPFLPLIGIEGPVLVTAGSPANAIVGETTTWVTRVGNPSGDEAIGPLTIVDQVPANFDIISISSSVGRPYVSGQTVSVNIGALQHGDSATLNIETVANDRAQPGEVCNTATAGTLTDTACITLFPGFLPLTGGGGEEEGEYDENSCHGVRISAVDMRSGQFEVTRGLETASVASEPAGLLLREVTFDSDELFHCKASREGPMYVDIGDLPRNVFFQARDVNALTREPYLSSEAISWDQSHTEVTFSYLPPALRFLKEPLAFLYGVGSFGEALMGILGFLGTFAISTAVQPTVEDMILGRVKKWLASRRAGKDTGEAKAKTKAKADAKTYDDVAKAA